MSKGWSRAGVVVAVAAFALILVPASAMAQGEVLYVVNDKVGIGTAAPVSLLDVSGVDSRVFGLASTGGDAIVKLDAADPVNNRTASFDFYHQGNRRLRLLKNYLTNDFMIERWTGAGMGTYVGTAMTLAYATGYVGFGLRSPVYPLQMASGAYVTAGGVWTNASSRAYKDDIADLSADAAEQALEKLNPVTYEYKVDPGEHHVGFIAEDVPDLVASKDRKGVSSMDVVAVLTKVVQQQQKTIAELKAKVEALEKK